MFTSRVLVQWVASERRRTSVIPVLFWWLSVAGGAMLLFYAILRKDPVIAFGQATGIVVYLRNLILIRRRRGEAPAATVRSRSPARARGQPPRAERAREGTKVS
jgi:lipid-A-disaccharide synthase-like uncharacterized protein